MTKIGGKVKKFLPLLATITLCLVIAVTLLIVLPLLTPSNADNGTATPPDENKQQHQVGENPSIDDQLNGGDNNDNQNTTTPDYGTTTPTEPTEPDPVDPVNPTPTEPEITEPEPVDPTPTEPDEPDTPEPPIEEPVFELTKDSLPNTVWYCARRQWQLTFSKKTYKLIDVTYANDENSGVVLESGNWVIQDSTIILTPKTQTSGWIYDYSNNTLSEVDWDYQFILTIHTTV